MIEVRVYFAVYDIVKSKSGRRKIFQYFIYKHITAFADKIIEVANEQAKDLSKAIGAEVVFWGKIT